MMKLVKYKKVPRPTSKMGYCNICSKNKLLTEDHVPPKGCVGINRQQVALLTEYLSLGQLDKRNAKQIQNGLKFKSICNDCNNRLLGTLYDPSLNEFAQQVSIIARLIQGRMVLPDPFKVKLKPLPVLKAIVGHLLAARVRSDMTTPLPSAPFISAMQQFVQQKDALPPEELRVFCWFYPSDIQVIILGSGIVENIFSEKRQVIIGDIIKFFPLGFWVTWDHNYNLEMDLNLIEIALWPDIKLSDELEIKLPLKGIPRIDWPEHQDDSSVMLMHDEYAFIAKKFRRKKMKKA